MADGPSALGRDRRTGAIRLQKRIAFPLAVLVGVAAGSAGFAIVRPAAEARLLAAFRARASRMGLSATVGSVRLRPTLAFELSDLVLENGRQLEVTFERLTLRPEPSLGGLLGRSLRASVRSAAVHLPRGLRIDVGPSTWRLARSGSGLRLERVASGERLAVHVGDAQGRRELRLRAEHARLGALLGVRLHGCPLGRLGTLDAEGRASVGQAGDVTVWLRGRMEGLALASLGRPEADQGCAETDLGATTDLEVDLTSTVRPAAGELRVDIAGIAAGGARVSGRLSVTRWREDPRVDLELDVPRTRLAPLLATAGLDLAAADLGSASFRGRVEGRILEPDALQVTQKLDFTPPVRIPPALETLRGPFVHRVTASSGRQLRILVSPASPDFVAVEDVPPLFLRALLLAEDANFYGHSGIDMGELPSAFATNLARGEFVRGGSTLSQQLAKNLFLSRRKTIARKLEEASLALLLDSALGKRRVLELYLNVIEWGPDLYGLRPAARHYFAREPRDLSVKQMAFLVRLIPGPLKYRRSFATGEPTPFFEGLIAGLLAKLEAVGALSPEEHMIALAEPLDLRPAGLGPPAAVVRTTAETGAEGAIAPSSP